MRLKVQWGMVAGFSVVALLSGCSAKQKQQTNAAASQGMQAKTYGLGQATPSQVASNPYAKKVNQMVAPSDQTYYFAFDSNELSPRDYAYVRLQADYLIAHPSAKVRLEGNTDNRGSREYNIGLGWRRDQSVQQIMRQEGVPNRQINMVSYGKEKPAVQGSTDAVWALNRRVHLAYEEK